jgi:hypothetical protein
MKNDVLKIKKKKHQFISELRCCLRKLRGAINKAGFFPKKMGFDHEKVVTNGNPLTAAECEILSIL